jgi:hypothetical protein
MLTKMLCYQYIVDVMFRILLVAVWGYDLLGVIIIVGKDQSADSAGCPQ